MGLAVVLLVPALLPPLRLLTCPAVFAAQGVDNTMGDWVNDSVWGSVQALKGARSALILT
jgi:hypothetical protein